MIIEEQHPRTGEMLNLLISDDRDRINHKNITFFPPFEFSFQRGIHPLCSFNSVSFFRLKCFATKLVSFCKKMAFRLRLQAMYRRQFVPSFCIPIANFLLFGFGFEKEPKCSIIWRSSGASTVLKFRYKIWITKKLSVSETAPEVAVICSSCVVIK